VSGFIGEGFKVHPSSPVGQSVVLKAGLGFQYLPGDSTASVGGISGLDDLSPYKPLVLTEDTTIPGLPAGPGAGQDRYDIIEVRMNRVLGNPLSRDVFDVPSGQFVSQSVNKTLSFTLDGSVGVVTSPASSTAAISYKQGVAAATNSAVEPATTSGYVKVATIFSKNGNMTTAVNRNNVIDRRNLLAPYGAMPFSIRASIPTGAASPPTLVSVNAPPGVEVCVSKTLAPLNVGFSVAVFAGGLAGQAKVVMHAETVGGVTSGTLSVVNLTAAGISTTTGLTSILNDATLTTPAIDTPDAQPIAIGTFFAQTQVGVTTAPNAADPIVVEVSGLIQLY
jgi:hypothetical protein